jgi:hypothetical protein
VKDGPGSRVNVVAALLAGIGPALGHRMKGCSLFAPRTYDIRSAKVDFHQLGQARGIVRVFGLELLERVFGHGPYPLHYLLLRDSLNSGSLAVKG